LGASLSRWLGSGDYSVAENSIVSKTMKGSASIPAMHKSDQLIVVRHREFLTSLTSASTYTVRAAFSLNPGLKSTFPWLAAVAQNYQEYRFKGVVFHYVPTSGMVTGTNTALGSVMFQTSYRASDVAPTTKYEMLNEFWSNESLPCEAMCHPIECKPSETILTSRYVRDGAVTDDVMFYDYGTTYVAVQGQQSTGQIIGDVWVTYEVELRKPKMNAALGKSVTSMRSTNTTSNPARLFSGSAITFNSFTGNVVITSPADNQHQVSLPAGNAGSYLVTISVAGATGGTGTPALTLVNCTALTNGLEGGSNFVTYAFSGIRGVFEFGVSVSDPTLAATITMTGVTVTAAGSVTADVFVTAIDADTSVIA